MDRMKVSGYGDVLRLACGFSGALLWGCPDGKDVG